MSFKIGGSYLVSASEEASRSLPHRLAIFDIILLDDSKETFQLDSKSKGQVLLDHVYVCLELLERDYFGLQFFEGGLIWNGSCWKGIGAMRWLDPNKPLKKQLPTQPPYTLQFRVRFYVPDPSILHEEYTRYQFFLQLRKDILEGRLICPLDTNVILASYILQSELGDYNQEDHKYGYVSEFRFIPTQTSEFEEKVASLHVTHTGLTPAEAELEFLHKIREVEFYGVELYDAKDQNKVSISLGVSAEGVSIFLDNRKAQTHFWENILKLSYQGRHFYVHLKKTMTMEPISFCYDNNASLPKPEPSSTVTFTLSCPRDAKYLWRRCIELHTFFRIRDAKSHCAQGGTFGATAPRFFGRTLQDIVQSKRRHRVDRGFTRSSSRHFARRTVAGTSRGLILSEYSNTLDGRHNSSIKKGPSFRKVIQVDQTNTDNSSLASGTLISAARDSRLSNRKARLEEDDDEGGFRKRGGNGVVSGGVSPLVGGSVRRDLPLATTPGTNGQSVYATGPRRPLTRAGSTSSSRIQRSRTTYDRKIGSSVDRLDLNQSTTGGQRVSHQHIVHSVSSGNFGTNGRSRDRITAPSTPLNAKVRIAANSQPDCFINGSGDNYSGSVDSCSHPASGFLSEQLSPSIKSGAAQQQHEDEGVVTIRILPDAKGRFGFNVKSTAKGAVGRAPFLVSRIGVNMPADMCIPRLHEGDLLLSINGRDMATFTYDQIVLLIKAAGKKSTTELVLVVRPSDYMTPEDSSTNPRQASTSPSPISPGSANHLHSNGPSSPPVSSTGGGGPTEEVNQQQDGEIEEDGEVVMPCVPVVPSVGATGNPLEDSILALRESLKSGLALEQFNQLYRRKPGLTMKVAQDPDNLWKNRYRDISPYDQTRVIVKETDCGDYINASYVNMEIPNSGIVNRYIAAQGPLPNTCDAFWQMCWEQSTTLVVMLTANVERGRAKCHQYWPAMYDTLDLNPPGLQLTCLREDLSLPGFASRELLLYHLASREERRIAHIQYLNWPDHGIPPDSTEFIQFLHKVRDTRAGNVEPTVVHCSAGIGRTGVLITMETAMCLIEANQPVVPLNIVREMRDQRAMLIQTPNQYMFVCDSILKIFNGGFLKRTIFQFDC